VTTDLCHTATKLITPPSVEPFTLSEAKLHCRIRISDEDALISKWITAARRKVEKDTGRALLTQTWDLFLDSFYSDDSYHTIVVPYPPLQSVTSVNSTNTAGAETVWPSSNYVVDTASEPGRIALSDLGSWPSSLRMFQPGRVRFVAGYATAADIPGELLQAMAKLIAGYDQSRELSAFDRSEYDELIGHYSIFSAA
jgi:uncharacterized phiE125 gp8 family phage protein